MTPELYSWVQKPHKLQILDPSSQELDEVCCHALNNFRQYLASGNKDSFALHFILCKIYQMIKCLHEKNTNILLASDQGNEQEYIYMLNELW